MPSHVYRVAGDTIKKTAVVKETEKAYSCQGGKALFTVVKKDGYATYEEAKVAWEAKLQARIHELELKIAEQQKILTTKPELIDETHFVLNPA